jgi:hypothetical protein
MTLGHYYPHPHRNFDEHEGGNRSMGSGGVKRLTVNSPKRMKSARGGSPEWNPQSEKPHSSGSLGASSMKSLTRSPPETIEGAGRIQGGSIP